MGLSEEIKGQIERCVSDSFSDSSDVYSSANNILDSNKNSQEYGDFYLVPAVFINDNLVKENLEIDMAISAICDKFENAPDICLEF